MRIAIAGTRGVPATYGGFETFAEELGVHLAARGHDVTIYGRSHLSDLPSANYRGIRVRTLPSIRHKYLETVSNTALSVIDSLWRHFDVVLICNDANAPVAWIPRAVGAAVVLNVDGLEWNRTKWGVVGRAYYRFCAWLTPHLPVVMVSDARVIADFYARQHRKKTVFIPYGTDRRRLPPGHELARLGLEADRYMLYVSRLEPENNAHVVVEAYRLAGGRDALGLPLVVVGDAPYATAYKERVRSLAAGTSGVILTGYVFGDGYVELQSNARIYIQATEVGGTHPALVEAMGRGACIIANDVPEHREVLEDAGVYYERNSASSLAAAFTTLAADDAERSRLRARASERSLGYSWEAVTAAYDDLFSALRRKA